MIFNSTVFIKLRSQQCRRGPRRSFYIKIREQADEAAGEDDPKDIDLWPRNA
jgi:hypothetical protein